ncbi:YafY family transcriptional regulator [Enterococcus gallinarum]|uniref:helix-turn-helix transcriptional regulator n=1 Tax=Enterococcus gallinarum TaxID=1353 RepID=UPI002DB582B0|nr:YafY family protein [Enterococcus gallinarum]MEB6065118.1 YafY family transcriptional regulator [Enterococcus gallinarum]
MNKSERLNDMMIYLNNKNFFNLSDLMEKYTISRSTALRDIQSLEAIGMPIFAEHGRYGRYGILKNRLLSPIIFTIDEMYALYFAMLTLREYQSTPFHLDLSKLKQKFESCISEEHRTNLNKMKTIFSFASFKQVIDSPFLKDILYSAINNSVNDITYIRSNTHYSYTVQFINISSSFGQWYVTAYNYESEKLQVFRCDKIISLSSNQTQNPIDIEKTKILLMDSFKDENATDFEVSITNKGIDIFLKENYPSMSLIYNDGKPIIKGYYNKNEENFISNYFLSYGKEIISIKPVELKNLILEKMGKNIDYLKSI